MKRYSLATHLCKNCTSVIGQDIKQKWKCEIYIECTPSTWVGSSELLCKFERFFVSYEAGLHWYIYIYILMYYMPQTSWAI